MDNRDLIVDDSYRELALQVVTLVTIWQGSLIREAWIGRQQELIRRELNNREPRRTRMKVALKWKADIARAVSAKCSSNQDWCGLNEDFEQDAMELVLMAYKKNPAMNDGLVRTIIRNSMATSIGKLGIKQPAYSRFKAGKTCAWTDLCIQGWQRMIKGEEFADMAELDQFDFSGLRDFIDSSSAPEILHWKYFEDMTNEQISDRMGSKGGMCPKTVRKRHWKALAEMRVAMLSEGLSFADFTR